MFEKYIIVPGSLRAACQGDAEGFSIDVRLAYYRGLLLSMVEGFEVSVDGEPCDPAGIILTVGGLPFSFAELADEADARWEFDEAASLFVAKPGGLAPGEHRLDVVELLRISYVPGTTRRVASQTMVLADWALAEGNAR